MDIKDTYVLFKTGYIKYNESHDEGMGTYFYSSVSKYQKINTDGTFVLKEVPNGNYANSLSSGVKEKDKNSYYLDVYDMNGNKARIIEQKLTCEPLPKDRN